MFVFFKQKTAYEMRISDWSSDVCSSDLRLCKVRILLVGAPAYFDRHGRPRHPRDLAEHRALQYAYSRSGPSWRFRHERHGEFTQSMEPSLRANNAEALTHALLAGLGLALQPEFLAWQDIQAGRLETVMDDWQVEPIALHILTPPGRRRPARVQAFIDYLAERFASQPWARGEEWGNADIRHGGRQGDREGTRINLSQQCG